MVYLCGRPLPNRGRCTLGRETAIQKMVWGEDGWLRTVDGDGLPTVETDAPAALRRSRVPPPAREDFDAAQLPIDFQWLRSPWPDELFSLTERPGYLRLYGRETIGSLFTQALVARRQQSHCYSASTIVEFEPRALPADGRPRLLLQQLQVPLPAHLDGRRRGKHLRVMSALPDQVQTDAFTPPIAIPSGVPSSCASRSITSVFISGIASAAANGRGCRSSSTPASSPTKRRRRGCRTSRAPSSAWRARMSPGTRCPADFDWFEYRERDYVADWIGRSAG